jgi:CDP-diglyceride synthetase
MELLLTTYKNKFIISMKKPLSIQEHIEQERLYIGDPKKGWVGFLIGVILFYIVWNLLFSIVWSLLQTADTEHQTLSLGEILMAFYETYLKYIVISTISFLLSLPITYYIFIQLSDAFEKFKPKIEQKTKNDDVLDAD